MKRIQKIKAAFFDRDGTLIKEVSYLSRLDQIEFIEPALCVCRELQNLGYKIFVVTNQSGVARGFFDEAFVQKTHEHLHKLLQERGITVQAWYYCPHHPTQATVLSYKKECACRKPKPGMLLQASRDFNIDLSSSIMIGDKAIDLQAGLSAGCWSYDINKLLALQAPDLRELLDKKVNKLFQSAI